MKRIFATIAGLAILGGATFVPLADSAEARVATTNVEYTLTVTDTQTAQIR
jgi:hypothetical protein